jgi:DNA-binding transcriptional LysR family regulator
VRSRYRVNSGELAVAGARHGLCFAIVAAYPCQQDLAEGRLQKVQLDLSPAPLQLLGAYSHRHSVTARVRALLEFIQARLQGVGEISG